MCSYQVADDLIFTLVVISYRETIAMRTFVMVTRKYNSRSDEMCKVIDDFIFSLII